MNIMKKKIIDDNKTPDILNNHNSLSNLSFPHNLNSANNNNNIFDFSANVINLSEPQQNKSMNDIPIKQILSPFNVNNNSLNLSSYNNMNNNTPFNRPVLSPMNNSPDIVNNNVISPCLPKSSINSPFFINVSPFNNNNFFNDHFAFNNINSSSFFFGNNENNNDNKNENKNNDNPSIEGNINFNNNENIENNNDNINRDN